MHRNEIDGEDRAADATRSPVLSPTAPPHAEPVKLGDAVRAVVIKAGKSRLHLRVFGLAPAKQGDRDQQER